MKVESGLPLAAVAIDRNKGSQDALKWAVDNIITKGQTLVLVHVNTKCTSTVSHEDDAASDYKGPSDAHTRELFLPFRVFCTRKDINCQDVVLDDADVVKALVEFVAHAAIEKLVLGASSKSGFVRRFKSSDIPSNVSKGSPDFCTVYIISKGKVCSVRNAIRSAPAFSPLRPHNHNQCSIKPDVGDHCPALLKGEATPETHSLHDDSIKSPFMKGAHGVSTRSFAYFSLSDTDISFVSSGRPSTSSGRPSADCAFTPRMSSTSDGFDRGLEMTRAPHKFIDSYSAGTDFSSLSQECSGTSWPSQTLEDVEAEMRRLRLELKQTMNMYDTACKEALAAKQKATELDHWRLEEEQRLREAQLSEESALALVERERAKSRAAIEAAEASHRIAELEAQKRIDAEMKALREEEDRKKALDCLAHANLRYRKYTIEEIEAATNYFADNRKIGEGGYGPVYKCYLDHTPVAIKVLRPDAAQGRSQFQQEVEILSCIRHPNMVLLLGACPEYGCLVYEYMANGSLDDRLFRRGNTPSIPWQHRFRIAAEIGTGLLFLHQTKPEPLVHRDLKPANILLDQNYVSKISDVGLARLVPPSVADNMTQCLMTSAAGTFCYIDPEYQQTGMLGVKSDIYSLGIMLLQLITAKPPMGLTHHVSRSIEKGMFKEVLDPTVPDWPVEEAMCLAEIALRCTELRRKDRPDLGTVVLPELDKLRDFAEEHMHHCTMGSSTYSSPIHSQVSLQDVMSDSLVQSGCDSSKSRSSTSSMTGRGLNAT